MMYKRFALSYLGTLLLSATLLLVGCGGGTGSSGTSAANNPANQEGPEGPSSFLLFPNPQVQSDATLQVNSTAYATAYYQAIDPTNTRATLAGFKSVNGFGTGGNEVSIIIGDQRDLGYGRKMTGRMNADGTIAFVVENYLVGYGPYSPFSLEAAIKDESRWHIGTNGIEFSPGPSGGVKFVKFYTFDPITGARLLAGNLDGQGDKAMPTICISCHGGRGDALTPTGLFPKLTFSQSGARGDISGQTHAFEPASFDFSNISGFTRAALEANIKELNKMVLCTYVRPTTETAGAFDACRRTANANEYQGTAAAHIKHMYGGNDLPNASAEATDSYLPGDWGTAGQSSLYANTVTNACRVCHSLRGNANQSDINLESFTKFDLYADRIKAHVIDRGNMPLVKLVYDKYWTTPSMNGTMATFLAGKGYGNAAAKPGRPVADPGPDRVIKSNTTTLSGTMSLYSSTYQWRVTSGNATLTNANTATPTFTAAGGDDSYSVQLVTSNGSTLSAPQTLIIAVKAALPWDPEAVSFNNANPANQIRTVLQQTGAGTGDCMTCHLSTASPMVPPVFYNDFDRAGNGVAAGTDATNRNWFYTEVRARINYTDIVASPLLRKPSGNHHNGGARIGFDTTKAPGHVDRTDYDKFVAWILRGAPEY
jgi:hypothetical protein